MDAYTNEAECGNDPQKCFLTVVAPRGTGRMIRQSVHPLLEWIDPTLVMIRIHDSGTIVRSATTHKTAGSHNFETISDSPTISDRSTIQGSNIIHNSFTTIKDSQKAGAPHCEFKSLCTPSLAVLLFLSERGDFSYKRMQEQFLHNRSWRLHHSIELTHKWSESLAGRQDFYSLFDHSPLWCVSESYGAPELLRFTIFVNDFISMAEFYRIVTETEMESHKPGFGVFLLYQQPGLRFELCLKHHKRLNPYPVPTAYLTFKTRNIKTLKETLGVTFTEVKSRQYRTVDPDGNTIVLYDVSPSYKPPRMPSVSASIPETTCDVMSDKNTCDNHDVDSGRFSDSDLCDSDSPASVEKLYWLKQMLHGECVDSVGGLFTKDSNGFHTPTQCATANKFCSKCKSCKFCGINPSITTSNSMCMCSSSKHVVNSPEGWIDGVFKHKGLLCKMKQTPQAPIFQTTCPEYSGISDCNKTKKREQLSEDSHFRQTFENEFKVTNDCRTVDKMCTNCVAVNQHQCSQVLTSLHPAENDEDVHYHRISTYRRNHCVQTPVFL